MAKGFKDDKGKFRPTEKKNGLSSNQLKEETSSESIDSGKAQMLKDRKEFVHGEPVIGYVNHHPVTLKLELREKGQPQQGVDLKTHENPIELSMSGSIWNLSRSDCTQCGQMQDTIRDELNSGNLRLKSNISQDDMKKLLDIWDRWHLNGLKAGTTKQNELIEMHRDDPKYAEQDVFLDRPRAILKDFDADPDNGYSYGSAWLFEPLSDDVIDFVKEMQGRLNE